MKDKKDIPYGEVEVIHAELKHLMASKHTLSRPELMTIKRKLKALLIK